MELKAKDLPAIWEWKHKGTAKKLLDKAFNLNDIEAIAILSNYEQFKTEFYIDRFFTYCGITKWHSLWKMI